MSINVLLGTEEHREVDDLESFFYVLLFLCLEYSGPGSPWDWDICKTELRRWIEGDFTAIGGAKSSDVTNWKRFKTIVLDNPPPYFEDLGNCLDELQRYIFHESQLSGHPITHKGLICILEARSKEPFDESVEEEATPSSKKPKRLRRGVINTESQRTESESEWGSEDDAGPNDRREDSYTNRERMEDGNDEGGDSRQDEDEDDSVSHWQVKHHHLQAQASRSDPALTTLFLYIYTLQM